VVKRRVALALKNIQQELAPQKLSLKMLDCYRPARAVHDMVVWAQDGRQTPAGDGIILRSTRRSVPAWLHRERIPAIPPACRRPHAGRSHADNLAQFDPNKAYADCTAGRTSARPEGKHRYGHRLRLFRRQGAHKARSITRSSAGGGTCWLPRWRRQGFVNYWKEWWHFSLPGAGGPAYDFPITARRN
jgi:D-alanyl-D-alanine dipeptidase